MGAAQSNASRQRPAQNNAPDLVPLDEFSTLAERHEQIRRLFRSVARELEELETAEHGGRDHHPLSKDWSILQRRHDEIFDDSVQNAAVSAKCLKALEKTIAIWQRSSTPEVNMEDIVDLNQQLKGHALKAHGIAVRFEELGEDIKQFKLHVLGFWTRLACFAIDEVNRLLEILLSMIKWVTSHAMGKHGTGYRNSSGYGPIIRMDVIDGKKLDSIEGLLSKTVKTWKALERKYAHLQGSLAAACSVVNDPERSDVYLEAARSSCMVLYECMSTYSTE